MRVGRAGGAPRQRRYAEVMDLATPPGASPARTSARRVRWGLPDAAWAWCAGVVGASLFATFAYAWREPADAGSDPVVFAVSIAGQYAGMVAVLVLISRLKGVRSLAGDFGLRIHLRDWWMVAVGFGVQIGANLALIPIAVLADNEEAAQDVVQRLESAGGLELAVIALTAALVAPVVEEILFRGLLLRALLRKVPPTPAIGLSALAFALVHLLDPGAIVVLPGLLLVGLVNGVLAVRDGDLSRPILLHVGFNLLVLVAALGGG